MSIVKNIFRIPLLVYKYIKSEQLAKKSDALYRFNKRIEAYTQMRKK